MSSFAELSSSAKPQEHEEIQEKMKEKQAIEGHLECTLCLSLICQPLSLHCGHSFCRICLLKALKINKKSCPICRSVTHIDCLTSEENIMIKAIARALNNALYVQREEEILMELNNYKNDSIYPIFYYNSNLFPGSTLSLHLFEPRYRIMMQRIVNSTKKFVYAPNFTNYRADVGDVVLIANLKSCEFLHDGRALLSAEIGKRYEVIEHWVEDGTQNLHYCRLSKYEDAVLSPSDVAIADPIVTMLNAITNSYFTPQILRRIEEQCGPKPASNDYEVSNPCVNHSLTSH